MLLHSGLLVIIGGREDETRGKQEERVPKREDGTWNIAISSSTGHVIVLWGVGRLEETSDDGLCCVFEEKP